MNPIIKMTHYYHRIIEIDAQTVEEFDMIFDAVRHLRMVSTVASPSMVLTYFGEVRMTNQGKFYSYIKSFSRLFF